MDCLSERKLIFRREAMKLNPSCSKSVWLGSHSADGARPLHRWLAILDEHVHDTSACCELEQELTFQGLHLRRILIMEGEWFGADLLSSQEEKALVQGKPAP